jgi:hypothetical protein
MNIKPTPLLAGVVLSLSSFAGPAEENHLQEAVKHADMAAAATDAKTIAIHAEESRMHAKTADAHLDAGLDSLDKAIEHGNKNEGAQAKKAAEEAAQHLKEAR